MDTPDLERLTLLERAQLLHDATLRRHGEMLDRHEDDLVHLRALAERQGRLEADLQGLLAHVVDRQDQHADWMRQQGDTMAQHAERLARYDAIIQRLDGESAHHAERLERLDRLLQAIKDLLPRGNGH